MKETAGIYKLTSPSGKVYIGQAYNLCRRYNIYKNLRCKSQPKLYNALVKYGWENFKKEILFEINKTNVNFIDILNTLESFYIEKYKCVENGYNCRSGGKNSLHSEETKKKMSEKKKGENHPNFGKHLSEEVKKKISEPLKGKTHTDDFKKHMSKIMSGENHPNFGKKISEETRKKLSEKKKGENHPNFGKHLSEETRKKLSEKNSGEKSPNFGKKISEETRKKLSESLKGKTPWNKGIPLSEETRKKLSEKSSGEKNPSAKKVNQYDMDYNYIRTFNCINDAYKILNNGIRFRISNVCMGKLNSSLGYKWKYFDDDPIENPIYN